MKPVLLPVLTKCLTLVLIGTVCSAAAGSNSVLRIAPPVMVRSVFVDDPNLGKDPFFPASTRRLEALRQAIPTNVVQQPNLAFQHLSLKGISGLRGQRLALINSSTVAVGEIAEIRCGQGLVKVLCREIRDRSVIVELVGAGEIKELKLRDDI